MCGEPAIVTLSFSLVFLSSKFMASMSSSIPLFFLMNPVKSRLIFSFSVCVFLLIVGVSTPWGITTIFFSCFCPILSSSFLLMLELWTIMMFDVFVSIL